MSLLLNNKRRRSTGGGGSDPFWNNVVLFLKGDGANGSTNIVDSSNSAKTVNRFGDTKISTTQSKYGGSSILFDGTGDYLKLNASSDFSFTSTDYTIEFWLYNNNLSYVKVFGGTWASTYDQIGIYSVAQGFLFYTVGVFAPLASDTIKQNQWQHIAVSRIGTTSKVFVDGISLLSTTSTSNGSSSSAFYIGIRPDGSHAVNAYIDSFRITKGVGRYNANFNPETDTYLS